MMGGDSSSSPQGPFPPDLVLAVVQDIDARGEHLVVPAEAIRLLLSAASQTFAGLVNQEHGEALQAVEYAVRRGALNAAPGADCTRLSKLALAQLDLLISGDES